MSHHKFLRFLLILALCAGFNLLWILRPGASPAAWWAEAVGANLAFLALVLLTFAYLGRLGRRVGGLRRTVQRLEFRVDDQEREARVLETISSVSSSFLNNVQVRTLLREISAALHRILAADATIIELLPQPDLVDTTTFTTGVESIELGPEVRRRVIDEGKSILINDVRQYPRYADLHKQGLRAMIAAPFKRGARVIGLIGAFASEERSFSSRDLRVLFTFATHTSLLLESAALLDAVRRLSLRTSAEQVDSLEHLRTALSVERDLADREFAVARRIQSELLPHKFPELARFALDALALPAREVGGDFFDVIPLGAGKWGLAVADVAGKGVPAALVMVMARTLLRAAVVEARPPRDVLLRINGELFEQTTADCFVSMFYGVWDDATQTLRYANAGHEPPLVVTERGTTLLPRGGIALGAINELENYLVEDTICLAATDALLLYTDGVREAMNEQGEMYGLERLAAAAQRTLAAHQPLIESLREDIGRFVAKAEQHDDLTLLVLQGR